MPWWKAIETCSPITARYKFQRAVASNSNRHPLVPLTNEPMSKELLTPHLDVSWM
jgi:hypothetical protein